MLQRGIRLLFFALSASASPTIGSPVARAAPSINPKDDPLNPLKYIPKDYLTTLGFVVYTNIAFGQSIRYFYRGARYMLPMIIGAYFFSAGVALRYFFARNPHSLGIYITEVCLVLLSPCGYIATVYAILGQMAARVQCGRFLMIAPNRIAKLFIISDVITLNVQSLGGGLFTAAPNVAKIGHTIVFVGLILQFLSFIFFTLVLFNWIYRVRKNEPRVWTGDLHLSLSQRWTTLALLLSLSCVGILIRSVYRIVEFSEGDFGRLTTTEIYFWVLDALPLAIAIGVYVIWWPEQMLPAANSPVSMETRHTRVESGGENIELVKP